MEKTLLLTISYDGRPFSGWQRQPSRRTVQGELEEALSEILRRPVKVDGCSRTDAGVHALGQCASFSGEIKIPTENLAYALNNRLPGSIRIVGCEEKPAGFHARFNSRGKTYLYRITTGPMKDPFRRDHVYHVTRPLDTERMRAAAGLIEGKHDFACFQAAGGQPRQTTVRTIYRLEVEERPWAPFSDMGLIGSAPAAGEAGRGSAGGESCGEEPAAAGREIRLHVTGDGFLYNMVRIITGTLVDVGEGKLAPEDIPAILAGGDRTRAGHTAPARGLYLARIYY